jgi:hypothetical protein
MDGAWPQQEQEFLTQFSQSRLHYYESIDLNHAMKAVDSFLMMIGVFWIMLAAAMPSHTFLRQIPQSFLYINL